MYRGLIFLIFFYFSYPTKSIGEHGPAKDPRSSDLYVLVHGRVWLIIRLGKAYILLIVHKRLIISTLKPLYTAHVRMNSALKI